MKYTSYNPLFPGPRYPDTGKKMRFTHMAMEIDDHFYDPDADPDRMVSLMYSLIFMVACKKPNFFKDLRDYDKFASGLATNLYLRYRKAASDPNLPKIKSVLNYIKRIVGPQRVTYQKSNFSQVWGTEGSIAFDEEAYNNQTLEVLESKNKDKCLEIVTSSCEYLDVIIMQSIPTPYDKDKYLSRNIYLSALLTIRRLLNEQNSLRGSQEAHRIVMWGLEDIWKDVVMCTVNTTLAGLRADIEDTLSKIAVTDDDVQTNRKAILDSTKGAIEDEQ